MKKKIYSANFINGKERMLRNIFMFFFLIIISAPLSAQNPLFLKNVFSGVASAKGHISGIVATSSGKTVFNSFNANRIPGFGGLWVTDGTAEGTTKLNTLPSRDNTLEAISLMALGDNKVVFTNDNSYVNNDSKNGGYGEIWVSDGTQGGTFMLEKFSPAPTEYGPVYSPIQICFPLGNTALYTVVTDDNHLQLHKTDGTVAGTSVVYDFGSASGFTSNFTAIGNIVYFIENTDYGRAIWRTDGTNAGTNSIKSLDLSYALNSLVSFADNLYFIVYSNSDPAYLWKSDGTNAGTIPLKQISAVPTGSIESYAATSTALYFAFNDGGGSYSGGVYGDELWKTDGTADGTFMVADINPGLGSSYPTGMVVLNNVLYFSASTPATGNELWKYDINSGAGAVLVKDINPGSDGSNPTSLTVQNNTLLFIATKENIPEYWVTDGSSANTVEIAKINAVGLRTSGNSAFFSALRDVDGDGILDPCIYKYTPPQKIWTGNVSSNASDVNNWFPAGVPTSADNVLFPVNATNPVNDPVLFLNDFVNNGSTVNIGSGHISINGNIYNGGTVNNNTGAGVFAVSGATTSDHTFGSPGIFNGEVTLSNNVNLHLTSSSYIPVFRIEGNDTMYAGPYSLTTDKFILAPACIILGNGSLSMPVGNTPVTFPVGVGNKSYTPVTITNNSGVLDYFNVSMKEGVFKNGITGDSITQQVVNKTWNIYQSTNNGSPNANITIQWNASDELPGFDRSHIYLNHYINGAWDTGTPGVANGSGPFTFARSGFTSFSPFSISSSASALPVTLIAFSANKINNTVQLNWQTTSEINVSFYTIERSADGATFSKIGQVNVLSNSSSVKDYSYTDAQPLQGANYYRLKMVDADGKFTYSKIVAVKIDDKRNMLQIFPNPAKNILNVQVNGNDLNGDATLQVIDITGRKVKEEKINLKGSSSFPVDVSQLSKGTYNVLLNGKSLNEQGKFVKE